MTRREQREHTFCMLFSLDFFHEDREEREQAGWYLSELEQMTPEDLEERELDRIPPLTEEEEEAVVSRIEAISARIPELDERINAVSVGWKTNRMNKVDLSLIRLALYEMKYDDTVPVKVAINEAVELAKAYAEDGAAPFVNGILNTVAKENGCEA